MSLDDFLKLQILLFKWLKLKNRELQIEYINCNCLNLLNSYESVNVSDLRNRLYHLFFPLVKMGLVEFAGDGKYALASSVLIKKESDKQNFLQCAGINLDNRYSEKLKLLTSNMKKDEFGIYRFLIERNKLAEFIKDNRDLPTVVDTSVSVFLKNIPTLKEYIISSEKVNLPEVKQRFTLGRKNYFNWKNSPSDKLDGLYRASEEVYSKRYFLLDNDYYKIEGREKNPDADFISKCYNCILSSRSDKLFRYFPNKSLLLINKLIYPYIPIVLERLLRIPSICSEKSVFEKDRYIRFPNIDISFKKELTRIFNYEMEIVNEKPS